MVIRTLFCIILTLLSQGVFAEDWLVGASLLYLQPALGGNGLGYSSFGNYAGADNQGAILTQNGENQMYNVHPKWSAGFEVNGAYFFGFENAVHVDWYHLDETVDRNLPPSLFSGSADGFYAGRLRLRTRWDAVELELAKHFCFSQRKLLRLYSGLEIARIKNTFVNYPRLFADSNPFFISKDVLSYTGLGPRFGMDFQYLVTKHAGVYAKLAGNVLVGTLKQKIKGYHDHSNLVYGLLPYGIANYRFSENYVVVPKLDGKLGVTYNYSLANGKLVTDLGYMWINYLQAISSYTGIGIVGSSVGLPSTTNFNLNGLYLNMSWSY